MQVPKVTEEAAQAVVELYPTPFLLAKAYSILVSPLPTNVLFPFIQVTIVTHVQNKMAVVHSISFVLQCYCVP